jgi:hypothetical protein
MLISAVSILAGTQVVAILLYVPPLFIRPSQYATLKANGISVLVSVETCSEGSKGGITCTGSFQLNGLQYSENILGVGYVATSGTLIPCLVDPRDPSDIYPTDEVYSNANVGFTLGVWIGFAVALIGMALSVFSLSKALNSKRRLGGWRRKLLDQPVL